jgi:hypothetical protein
MTRVKICCSRATLKRAYRGIRPKWRRLIGQSGKTHTRATTYCSQIRSSDSSFHPPFRPFFLEKLGLSTNVGFSREGWTCIPLFFSYIPDPRHLIIDPSRSPLGAPTIPLFSHLRKVPTTRAIAVYRRLASCKCPLMKYVCRQARFAGPPRST